ncbi:NAD(P)H-hydrate dehydratase [Dokdonella immobilis]|uniref:Bifunctional NAD(P)H-hydrate repair enzyme n=1 Tax=Dokdonella immobilis TaxID=578942 RepID=A0A1I4WL59_9GAMM|nr:NAD(P)H-hydrate dehydratase [Dokdonella immobilis]SFN13932.1 NAD(P)H-hydrate epimerase [Dokdonella immobilis]
MPTSSRSTNLYTVEQVRRIDQAAIREGGLPGTELMQRAATAAFAALRRIWPQARTLTVIAGSGNNGGDAFLLARLAREAQWQVQLVALGERSGGDAAAARDAWIREGGRITVADMQTRLPDADVLVDGLFGTGIARAPEGVAAHLIEAMNAFRGGRLALDVPSGLDADNGTAPGPVLRADATVSFVGWKRGLFTADGVDCCGQLELDLLGIPDPVCAGIGPDCELLEAGFANVLPPRIRNVNKGRFGHVLIIGGDIGMPGSVRLAGEAALRVGAGLVSIATRAQHIGAVVGDRPELMAMAADGPQSTEAMLARASVLAVGPGLGQGAWGHALWDKALRAGLPLVLDADGLNLLARQPLPLPATTVLTPHPGEAARLLGCDTAAIQADRFAAARALASRYACVVVLKGAGSLVAAADGRIALCPFGNPGMASAGMGDVLTGVVAGLLAQGLGAWDAACLGTLVHARAGDRAAGPRPRGMIASDLFEALRDVVNGSPS